MHTELPFVVAAPAHPSLDGAIARFCDVLRAEVGPGDQPTTSAALIGRLATGGPGPRLAAVHDGQIVGVARVDTDAPWGPELLVAVVGPWRGRGVGRTLTEAVIDRALQAGLARIVVPTGHRGRQVRDVGDALGCRVVDVDRHRLDLLRTSAPSTRSA